MRRASSSLRFVAAEDPGGGVDEETVGLVKLGGGLAKGLLRAEGRREPGPKRFEGHVQAREAAAGGGRSERLQIRRVPLQQGIDVGDARAPWRDAVHGPVVLARSACSTKNAAKMCSG